MQHQLTELQTLFVYVILVVGILAFAHGAYELAATTRKRSEAKINRRLALLAGGTDPKQVLEILRRNANPPPSWLQAIKDRFLPFQHLDRLLAQAGMTISMARLFAIMGALAVAIAIVMRMVLPLPWLAAVGVGLALGTGVPLLLVVRRRQKRMRRFAEQLPEATDLIVRSLRVGHPLTGALAMIADELPDPIGSEFGIAVDEMTYGLDLKDAIENLSRRISVPDLQYMTVAINVQYGTGGNLAEVLEGLSKVIRDRFQMYRKIRAVSAEGRLSAVFLTFFPMVVVAGIWAIYPDYYAKVADHPLFMPLASVGGVLLILNSLLMRWLVNFKV